MTGRARRGAKAAALGLLVACRHDEPAPRSVSAAPPAAPSPMDAGSFEEHLVATVDASVPEPAPPKRDPAFEKRLEQHPPEIHTDPKVTVGTMWLPLVQRIVRQQMGRIRLCYVHLLETDETLTAKVDVKFEIAPTGHVQNVTTDSTAPDSFRACVADIFTKLVFPTTDSGEVTRVTYPLRFTRADKPFAPAKRHGDGFGGD